MHDVHLASTKLQLWLHHADGLFIHFSRYLTMDHKLTWMAIVIFFSIIKLLPESKSAWTETYSFQTAFSLSFCSPYMQLHYLSSASSFYFVYDFCLSSHLSTAHSYLLRYIPALTALIVFFAMWLVRLVHQQKKRTCMHFFSMCHTEKWP